MNDNELINLKKDIESFLINEVYPLEKKVLTHGWNKSIEDIEKKREKVKSLGYWIPQIPKKYGGMGLSLIEFSQISSILGSSPIGLYLFNCQAPDAGNMEILIEYGTKYKMTGRGKINLQPRPFTNTSNVALATVKAGSDIVSSEAKSIQSTIRRFKKKY